MNEIFPFCTSLLPTNLSQTEYCGIFTHRQKQFRFNFRSLSSGGKIDINSLKCDQNLASLLNHRNAIESVKFRLSQTTDVNDFVSEFEDIVKVILDAEEGQNQLTFDSNFFARILSEIDAIGWSNLNEIDLNRSKLQLRVVDEVGRSHFLNVTLPFDYPKRSPEFVAELPEMFDPVWIPKTSSLSEVLQEFKNCIKPFMELWSVLDDFDNNTWILEPEKFNRAICERRVAIAPNCSVFLSFDALSPFTCPEIKFFGSENQLSSFKKTFARNYDLWDNSIYPRNNLENLLEISLPSPSTYKMQDLSADCAICYGFRGEDEKETPDKVCENRFCSKPYHKSCLLTWLQGLSDSRTSFGTVFGTCPYCSFDISVKY